MKPLMLSIQAFGPFVNKEEIDFTKLGSNPLFLINGPTGSGKSTILDAICFALYGKTTGADRDGAQMRCDLSDDKMLTTVTLDFMLGKKSYRVSRSPTQFRAKARGEGLTEHAGEANLWSLDSVGETTLMVAKKLKDVSDEIENITGLNVEQFRQVMVLPQGKFRDLLLADSADREKIFSKLFQTNIYKRIEENLKHKAIKISSDKKDHDSKIKGILISVDLDSEEQVGVQLKSYLDELADALINKDKINKVLQDELSLRESAQVLLKQFDDIDVTKQKIEKQESRSAEIETKKIALSNAVKADKLSPYYADVKRLKKEFESNEIDINHAEIKTEKLSQMKKKAETDLVSCKDKLNNTESIKQQVNELITYEKKAKDYVVLLEAENKSKIIYELSHNSFVNMQKKQSDLINNIDSFELEKTEIQDKLTELSDNKIQLSHLHIQFKSLQLKANLKSDLIRIKAERLDCQKKLDILMQRFEESKIHAKQRELSWHMGQAAILALQLKDDSPCPVCGSESHPAPAGDFSDDEEVVTKEEVDSARVKMDECRALMQAKSDQVNELDNNMTALKKRIVDVDIDLGEFSLKSLSDLEKQITCLQKVITSLEKQQLHLDKIKINLIDSNASLMTLNGELVQTQKQLNTDKVEYKLKQAEVKKNEESLPEAYRDAFLVSEKRQQLERDIKRINTEYDQALQLFDTCNIDITKQLASNDSLLNRKAAIKKQFVEAESKWSNALDKSDFKLLEDFKSAILEDALQEELSREIDEFNVFFIELKASLQEQLKLLDKKSKPDLAVIEQACNEKQIAYKEVENTWKNLDARVNQLKSIKTKLKRAHEKSANLEAEYAIYGTLSLVANGRTGSNISLQRFVLSVLLDDVLIEASRRLSVMSKGRFKLLRKLDKSKGNKASGLELDVEDAYTGKTRSVATLSGGESFMAALALALGLSDVVQAYAGGIKLDTLFIDEGFGSLDQESLDLAIRTLIDLQATGRMIGIISHVSELKEQMSLRLDVVSSKTGSKIKLVAA